MLLRKFLLLLPVLALLNPLVSSAQWNNQRTNSNAEAYAVCGQMPFSSDANACMAIVRGRYFQSDALRYCSQKTFQSEQLSCMKQIADKSYDPAALHMCQSLTFSSEINKCMSIVENRYFQAEALNVCSKKDFDSERLSCLNQVANQSYDPAALHVCQSLTFSSDTNKCMNLIANRAFDRGALSVCAGMTFESEILSCLNRSGYQPQRRTNRQTTQDILLDALDKVLRDMLSNYLNDQGRICSVVNSNASYLGEVSESKLVDAGRDFARSQRSCVVTNVKGEVRTRTLIGANGSVIARQLTENEASRLKRRAGYSSCRVMTCEIK